MTTMVYIIEDVEVNGIRQIHPIKVKSEPDRSYITIDLTKESATLPSIIKKLPEKRPSEYASYDETEMEDENYLPDDVPILTESDLSATETFEDKDSIRGSNTDSLQWSLIKLADRFRIASEAYRELAKHLPQLPTKDIIPIVESLPTPPGNNNGPVAHVIDIHSEDAIMNLVIRKGIKRGMTGRDIQRLYGVSRGHIFKVKHRRS